MSDISSVGHGPVGPLNRPGSHSPHLNGTARPESPSGSDPRGDRLELSEHARHLAQLREHPGLRMELIQQIRQAIADGTYETPERLNTAVERLMHDIGP